MPASNIGLFSQLPVPMGVRLTTAGTQDGVTATLLYTAGPEGACIKRLVATTVGSAVSSATLVYVFLEVDGVRINRGFISLAYRPVGAAPVSAEHDKITPANTLEIPPNGKVYVAMSAKSTSIDVDVAADGYTYTAAEAV